jgi:D-Tyr-tRNAtyr deacylase
MAKQTFTTGQVLTAAQMTSLQETAMGGGPATAKTANYVLVAADAGTTVAMDAAGATTITVNTGLFAAGDTVFIQNLGAGACTITAE